MEFQELIEEYILPLFPGASFDEPINVPKKIRKLVTQYINNRKLALLEHKNATSRLVIQRSQPFSEIEIKVIEYFIDGISAISDNALDEGLKNTLYPTIFKQALAKSIAMDYWKTIVSIIDSFERLSGRTYEGENLSLAFGIKTVDSPHNGTFITELLNNDFGLVLSNGINSLLVASQEGCVFEHIAITDTNKNENSPISYLPLANWTKGDNKVAIVLNRNGEVLIFSDGKLLYSKRRQKWQFYSHDSIRKVLALGKKTTWKPELRASIYESLLDVSFSRSGGLICLLPPRKELIGLAQLVEDDIPGEGSTIKSKFIASIKYEPFQKIDRRIRQEILAIDGSVLLDYKGNILNIGGIVTKIQPSADGGARTAAAKALSKNGIAVKISMDGMIKGYNDGKEILLFA